MSKSKPVYASRSKPIKGTVVLRRQSEPPNGPWVTIAEFSSEAEVNRYLLAVDTHDALVAAVQAALEWDEGNVSSAMAHHEPCPPCFDKELKRLLRAALASATPTGDKP